MHSRWLSPPPSAPLLLLLGLLAATPLGCSNVCEKAADHMDECVRELCAREADNALCAAVSEDAPRTGAGSCSDAAQEQAERVLALSCDAIFAGQALGTGAAAAPPTAE